MPSKSGAKLEVRKIVVGPSAPPIIPIEAASLRVKYPVRDAPQKETSYVYTFRQTT